MKNIKPVFSFYYWNISITFLIYYSGDYGGFDFRKAGKAYGILEVETEKYNP